MSPTDPAEGVDWHQVLTLALDVAAVAYLAWTISPTFRLTVTSAIDRIRSAVAARQRAEHDRRWLEFTLYEIRSLPETEVTR